jgi:tRNA pseudouridine38-40 synthase
LRVLKFTLAYDGTSYVGWQRQPNGVSIQALVEDALAPVEGRPVTVVGAGRTDAGVHALGQVASAKLASPIEPGALERALNARLPPDVRVRAVVEAPSDFHARFSATSKHYRYRIRQAPAIGPFEYRHAWHVPQALDTAAMAAAAQALVGRHDFASFQGSGSDVETTERTLTAIRVSETEAAGDGDEQGRLLIVEVEADGFLRHMVRTIAGTLVEVGTGRRPPDDLGAVLAARDRRSAGPTAPARGLFLVRVRY